MSVTMNPESSDLVLAPRSVFDQDWRKLINNGLLVAIGLVFIALANMPVGLDSRTVIEPVLSMGYLSLLWLPAALVARLAEEGR